MEQTTAQKRETVQARVEDQLASFIQSYGSVEAALRAVRLEQLRRQPDLIMDMVGMKPDPWQREVIQDKSPRILELITRQGGKSTTTAGRAYAKSALNKDWLTLILSPTERQSGETFKKVMAYHNQLQLVETTTKSTLQCEFANGARIVALPGKENTIRSYSGVNELIIDEASRVPDDVYRTVRPMLAVSGGTLISLTTPFGKRGFFFEEWTKRAHRWKRYKVTAHDVPRISEEFLKEELETLGELWFGQEYMCEFVETISSMFSAEMMDGMLVDDIDPLFEPKPEDDVLKTLTDAFREGFTIE